MASHKARDLNPKFIKRKIVEGDYWHAQWRDFQTAYFKEAHLDLSVDLNHLISERHEGSFRNKNNIICVKKLLFLI